jgi:hypothetical protein
MLLTPSAFAAMLLAAVPPTELATLAVPNGASGDEAGRSVSASGERVLMGVPLSNAGSLSNRGAAWVFRRTAEGAWTTEAELLAPDGAADDEFGLSVSLDGDVAIVGALNDDVAGKTDAGSASIFRRGASGWAFEATVIASDGQANDEFGRSVAIRGDVAIVGAWTSGLFDQGAAYVFRRQSNGTWLQTQKLTPPGSASGDQFGTAIAFDGVRVIIGAWGDEDGPATNSGSASVFRSTEGGPFIFEAKLIGADVVSGDELGRGVAIDDTLAVVGSWPFFGNGIGKAYVFRRNGTTWTQEAKLLAPDGATDDYFGFSVACARSGDRERIACGAWADDVAGMTNQGSVWIFERDDLGWSATAQLVAADGGPSDYFGFSLSFACETLAVGVRLDDVASATNQGTTRLWWIADDDGDGEPDLCSPTAGPTADLNGDGSVDAADLAILLGAWGSRDADLDGNGTTDAADLAALLGAWSR